MGDGVLSFAEFCLSSCTSELDVQQAYDFSLQTLPVQKDIIKGAVAEIRCSLKAEGDFNPNRSLDPEQISLVCRADCLPLVRRRSGLRRERMKNKMPTRE